MEITKPVHILVVDEEEPITDVLRLALELEGWRVSVAHSGADAIAFDGDPDVVLLDMMLPDCRGTDVVAEMRLAGSRAHVIFLTGRSEHDERMAAYEAGADDYITKPFGIEEVIDRVHLATRRLGIAPGSLRVDDLVLDLDAGLAWRGDVLLHLTSFEFELLRALVERRGSAQSTNDLVRAAGERNVRVPAELADRILERTRDSVNAVGTPLVSLERERWLVA
jgi:two-component system OmpR family response regulator